MSPTQITTIDQHHQDFPLQGGHKQVACISCHLEGQFVELDNLCATCHATDFEESKEQIHLQLKSDLDCAFCHQISTWNDSVFNHMGIGFDLEAAHKEASCSDCHAVAVEGASSKEDHAAFTSVPTDCVGCHLDEYTATTDPNHVELSYPIDCLECHAQESWQPSIFDHSQFDFSLNGAHQETACSSCHLGGVYEGTPTECIDCHQSEYQSVSEPNHLALSFPTDCLECHSESAWQPSSFDHSQFDFSLNGAHQETACSSCHLGGVYEGTPTECIDCHQSEYQSVSEPNHLVLSFPTDCLECHTESAWQPSSFDHSQFDFSLNGAHQETACSSCHLGGVYEGTPTECIDCHQSEYQSVSEPNHLALSFPTDCLECHSESAWQPSSFDHSQFDFSLNGAHQETACSSCHIGGVYEGTPTECIDCHQSEYQSVSEPNHLALSFPTDCLECHSESAWQPSSFDHSQFDFSLNGAHQETACSSCHIGGVYAGTPTQCIDCHSDNFQAAENPVHVAPSFSLDCLNCHTERVWEPSFFDHDDTGFVLTGAHRNTDCASCHADGVYANTPTSCISCHATDEPRNHFGPDCAACHTERAWTPSTFNHERYFPINRGNHRDYRNECSACHLNPASYSIFSCIDCHDGEHRRGDMDDEHRGIRGYIYQSAACYSCHPDGDD